MTGVHPAAFLEEQKMDAGEFTFTDGSGMKEVSGKQTSKKSGNLW